MSDDDLYSLLLGMIPGDYTFGGWDGNHFLFLAISEAQAPFFAISRLSDLRRDVHESVGDGSSVSLRKHEILNSIDLS